MYKQINTTILNLEDEKEKKLLTDYYQNIYPICNKKVSKQSYSIFIKPFRKKYGYKSCQSIINIIKKHNLPRIEFIKLNKDIPVSSFYIFYNEVMKVLIDLAFKGKKKEMKEIINMFSKIKNDKLKYLINDLSKHLESKLNNID